jgi:hypothetical protein
MGKARCRMLDGGTPTNAFLMETEKTGAADREVGDERADDACQLCAEARGRGSDAAAR